MQAPMLSTPRLTLRPHVISDFADSLAMWSDPRTVEFIGGTPSPPDRAWQRLLTYAGLWSLLGFGYWAVRETASDAFIGEVGFADFHRGTDPGFDGEPEMGWAIAPDHYGQGYATEAVTAALAWAEASLPYPRAVCMIAPGNAVSIAVARKCGFSDWTTTSFGGSQSLLFQRVLDQTR